MNYGISSIQLSTGRYKTSIKDYCNQFGKYSPSSSDLANRLASSCGIDTKCISIDLAKLEPIGFDERNAIANEAALDMINECLDRTDLGGITHVISSTTTVYGAPGLDALVVDRLGSNVVRYTLHSMGCTGGGAALNLAHDLVRGGSTNKVLIICVDVCSPYLFKDIKSNNDVVSGVIFSDGCAVVLVEASDKLLLKFIESHSYTAPNTLQDMTVSLNEESLDIRLSRNIHKLIPDNIDGLLSQFDGKKAERYLVHPGGKSILKALEDRLDVSLKHSWDVLRDHGNMSAPTTFFVIDAYLRDNIQGEIVDCLCFGQGLYMTGTRFQS